MKQLKLVCVVVLLLAAVVAEGKQHKKQRPSPPHKKQRPLPHLPPKPLVVPVLDLDGSSGDQYSAFISKIEGQIRLTTTTLPIIGRRAVLGVQKPRSAQCLDVVIRGGGNSSTLTVRTDNIHLVGFKTAGGSSYAFKLQEHFIHGSKSLRFKGDYAGLIGGHLNLAGVHIGKQSALEAVGTLASYSSSTPDAQIKRALTQFVLMICEATRFVPIRAAVKKDWQGGATFPQVGVQLVVLWRETSCAILVLNRKKGKWSEIKEVIDNHLELNGDPRMTTVDHALDNIIFLLRPAKPCSDGKTFALDY